MMPPDIHYIQHVMQEGCWWDGTPQDALRLGVAKSPVVAGGTQFCGPYDGVKRLQFI